MPEPTVKLRCLIQSSEKGTTIKAGEIIERPRNVGNVLVSSTRFEIIGDDEAPKPAKKKEVAKKEAPKK